MLYKISWPGNIKSTSFKFSDSLANRYSTRLINITPVVFDELGVMIKSFKRRNLIIEIPAKLANGTTYSKGNVAEVQQRLLI